MDSSNIWSHVMHQYRNSILQLICIRGKYNPFRPHLLPQDIKVSGSGFIVDIEQGLVLTNAHVVSNAISIVGRMMKLGEYDLELKLISICREKDIAVCQLNSSDIQKLLLDQEINQINMQFADSLLVQEADPVAALGFPLGFKGLKITVGIVSGFYANTEEEEDIKLTGEESPSYIQTSAAINSGNSGGPLLNIDGKIIGVNAAGYNASEAQNISYSIPSRTLLGIYDELIRPLYDASISTPYVIITPKYAFEYNRSSKTLIDQYQTEGVYVRKIYPNSCFPELKEGDILSQIIYLDNYYQNPSALDVINSPTLKSISINAMVDRYGDVTLPNTQRKFSIKEIFDFISIGQEISLIVTRKDMQSYELKSLFNPIVSSIRLPIYPRITPFKFEIIAGLNIGELTINHLKKHPSLEKYGKGKKRYRRLLVVNMIFPDTESYHTRVFKEGSIIVKVNNKKVETIQDLRGAILNTSNILTLEGDGHEKFMIQKEEARIQDLKVLSQFNITNYVYLWK